MASANIITNCQQLATTKARSYALDILESGLEAIDTASVIDNNVSVTGQSLFIGDEEFSLKNTENIYIVGFGKAACETAQSLENLLGDNVSSGVVIDVKNKTCQVVDSYVASHPKPTSVNVEATKEVVELAGEVTENDLVIVGVSGGGSSLLCWPPEECEQSQKVYDKFLDADGSITELNTIRKHLSELKGGGLAKKLYPAQIVGLIFSDVPGGELGDVASGPTFPDQTTVSDAKQLIDQYDINGDFTFYESPDDSAYFENVTNIPLVTNKTALNAMQKVGEELDLDTTILSDQLYERPEDVVNKLQEAARKHEVVVAGGEMQLQVPDNAKKGGRNQHTALTALLEGSSKMLFLFAASDGIDNNDAAGAVADSKTMTKAQKLNIDPSVYRNHYDSYTLFKQTGDLIQTGPTDSNVADLMMAINI